MAIEPTVGNVPQTDVSVDPLSGVETVRRILVVDDSRAQRRILSASLTRQGYEVIEAASGDDALGLLKVEEFDLILSDWMMPGMDGLELCQALRKLPRDGYVYFILLTSKTEKGAVAQGLNVGADDFLAKPVNPNELRARISAGARILSMERELQTKNRLVNETLSELQAVYDSLDRDLLEARKMQQSLVREKYRDFGKAEVSLMLMPCGHVGGDLVGFFEAGPNKLGFYAIDVSGHGIASALLTTRLASYLSDGSPTHNIALTQTADGALACRPPNDVARDLNTLLLDDMRTEHYFTMMLGNLDLTTGKVELSQCGHPNAALLSANGKVSFHGEGGLPIGLIPGAEYETLDMQMSPGDRLIFYSDGFTECEDKDGNLLDEDGFAQMLGAHGDLTNELFFNALVWDLDTFGDGQDVGDDLSCIMVTYRDQSA